MHDAVVLVAEHEDGDIVGVASGEVNVPARFSDERARRSRSPASWCGRPSGPWGRPGLVREAPASPPRTQFPGSRSRGRSDEGSMAFWEGGFTPRVVQLTSSTPALEDRMDAE